MPQSSSLRARVETALQSLPADAVFVPHDLRVSAPLEEVRLILGALRREGVLQRLHRDIYFRPVLLPRLGAPSLPSSTRIAEQWVRLRGLPLQPTGAQCANGLGWSTQVPARAVFLLPPGQRPRQLCAGRLRFLPAAPGTWIAPGTLVGGVVQALAWLGASWLRSPRARPELHRVRDLLVDADREAVAHWTPACPAWMQDALTQLSARA